MKTNRTSKVFGKVVRELRLQKHWTQDELAAQLDVAAGWISMIENGKRNPTLETILRLANALDVRVHFGNKKL
jgi:transcriptional regulator with XRE-family HTH domain